MGQHPAERFLTGLRFHQVLIQFVEQCPQDEEIRWIVIDQKNVGLGLGRF
jgi:hypothetical protein